MRSRVALRRRATRAGRNGDLRAVARNLGVDSDSAIRQPQTLLIATLLQQLPLSGVLAPLGRQPHSPLTHVPEQQSLGAEHVPSFGTQQVFWLPHCGAVIGEL